MANNRLLIAYRLYGVLLSISILIAGLCLAAGCITIYAAGGDAPYSREVVTQTFAKIAVPVYLCLGLTVFGFVWAFVSPLSPTSHKSAKPYAFMRERLIRQKDLTADAATLQAIQKEQAIRRRHALARTVLLGVGIAVFLLYSLQGQHFDAADINGSVIRAMLVALPCFAVPFGYAVFAAYQSENSLRREIELLKTLPSQSVDKQETVAANDRLVLLLRLSLLALGAAALLYGYLAGGTADVLTKAVNICTECIGLG